MTATKTRQTIAQRIKHLRPCGEANEWASKYTSPAKAWAACERGDWMMWLIGKASGPPESAGRKKLVLCACDCARLALPIFEKRRPNDDRVRKCIETAERWANGKATINELRAARKAAAAAAGACDAYYAAAAAAAAYAATAAYAYAATAAAAYARAITLKQCADIVRKHYPKPPAIKP